MIFCLHFSNSLDQDQIETIRSSIDKTTFGKFEFSHNSDGEFHTACVFVDAVVEFPKEYFQRLSIQLTDPNMAIIYSDVIWISRQNEVPKLSLLPDWSPERFLAIDYLGPVLVVVQSRINSDLDFSSAVRSQIVLAAMSTDSRIARINDLHYLQISDQQYEDSKTRTEEITRFLAANRPGAKVVASREQLQKIEYSNSVASSVSIVIPTRGTYLDATKAPMVVSCVESLLKQEVMNLDVQIVVVYDTDADIAYLKDLEALTKESKFSLSLVPYKPPFNFSSKCNLGALNSNGEVIIFLNDDTLCISNNVISELAALSRIPDVGAVGAKLLFQEGLIQHGGYVIRNHAVGHAYLKEVDSPRVFGDLQVTHEVAGVTGACLAQRREVFEAVGMWDESLPSSYNDVDFCFRISSRGYRILQANNVVLKHYESITRNPHVSKSDRKHIEDRWPTQLATERFFRSIVTVKQAKSPSESGLFAYFRYGSETLKNDGLRGLFLLVLNVVGKTVALLQKQISN
jgi:GT2 family glycosyltransferase